MSSQPLPCPFCGMTMRDYFAGQALPKAVEFGASPESTALRCYAIADAMIAARGEAQNERAQREHP